MYVKLLPARYTQYYTGNGRLSSTDRDSLIVLVDDGFMVTGYVKHIVTARKRSLGQGSVSTDVCPQEGCVVKEGGCDRPRGRHPPDLEADPLDPQTHTSWTQR